MAHDAQRRSEAFYKVVERDEAQYRKAAEAVHAGKMQPIELGLLWDQLAKAHAEWMQSLQASGDT